MPRTEMPGTEFGTEKPGTEKAGTEMLGTEEPGTKKPGTEWPGFQAVGMHCKLAVFAPCRRKSFDHRLATGAGFEISAVGLEDSPLDSVKVDLRPALLHLCNRELLEL